QAGFIAVIDGLARDHPVLMVFEDVHSLKPAMLDLIERLAIPGRRGPRRALILALARDDLLELRPSWGQESGNAVLLRLEPLTSPRPRTQPGECGMPRSRRSPTPACPNASACAFTSSSRSI